MYYSNDSLSILQAVTKSTLNTSTPTTHDLTSPPSPVAPMFDPNDSENDDYSYAIISTGEIDLAAIKKEKAKAQRLERLIEDEGSNNTKGDVDSSDEKDNIIMPAESQGTRYYCNLIFFAVLTICFMVGALSLLDDGNGMNRLSSTINTTKDLATTHTLKLRHTLWHWQDYVDKLQWDESKTWIHQEKATLITRLLVLQHRLAKQLHHWFQAWTDYSSGWMDKAT